MSLSEISDRITAETQRVGRPDGSVSLIAVSKVQPNARIETVLDEGHRIFGENKVQEAAGKWPDFRARYDGIELHLLGPLQSNKTRQAMELFDVIHSLDRLKIARGMARIRDEIGTCPDLYVQVNTGDEPQKAGVVLGDVNQFVTECKELGLPIVGLMCLPPADEEPSLHFALLKKLADRHNLQGLSMGMSGDFETAIAQGATCVRVGSAIFGERVSPE